MAEQYDAIIIGGGPAGLFCAINAHVPGSRILILEKNASCGKKLLIAGSGQCNFTNDEDIRNFLSRYGRNGSFLKHALFSFTNRNLVDYFSDHGVPVVVEKTGKIFSDSRSSRDILACLLRDCVTRKIIIREPEPVLGIRKDGDRYTVTCRTEQFSSRYLAIATGGASYPITGSSGDGYQFAQTLGHTIVLPSPALTPVACRNFPFGDLAGISFRDAFFSLWRNGKRISRFQGDILFTHNGLSGPGILDNSRWMMRGDEIRLSLAGDIPRESVEQSLILASREHGKKQLLTALCSFGIPFRLVQKLLEFLTIDQKISCAHVTSADRKRVAAALIGFPFTIDTLGDFSVAMVTQGGVSLDEILAKTMESRLSANLFFAGEVMDIDGDSGGYNLQAAFSTGYIAGSTIRSRLAGSRVNYRESASSVQ